MVNGPAARPAPFALDPLHPNHERWRRAVDAAETRGELVCAILARHISLSGARVLDAGCGVGGTALALWKRGADVIALDRDPARLEAVRHSVPGIHTLQADAALSMLADDSRDAVILQDMIEHTASPAAVLREAHRVLVPGGVLYLSTPNRHALINLVSDPHWGLPFVSMMNRPAIRRMLARHRPADVAREDLAELLSWSALRSLLAHEGFAPTMETATVAECLFMNPEAVVWSDLHLRLVRWARFIGLPSFLPLLRSDRVGVMARLAIPTWYLVARKIPR